MMSDKRRLSDIDPDYEDYEDVRDKQTKRRKVGEKDAKEATVDKIQSIIEKEFDKETLNKEAEIELIDERLRDSKLMLSRLKACIVATYYTKGQQSASRGVQIPSIHPAVREHLGKTLQGGMAPQHSPDSYVPTEGAYYSRDQTRVADSSRRSVSRPEADYSARGRWSKIKKKIIVGNISKYIPPDKRGDENDRMTHKWMVYVRGAKEEPAIDDFIHKVRFFLDPSYRPNDIVDVSQPPFHLTRRCWGQFPIRVQLHFKDPRNKAFDIIHQLVLDKTYTGLQTLGAETVVDIELERELPVTRQVKAKSSLTKTTRAKTADDHTLIPASQIKQEPVDSMETDQVQPDAATFRPITAPEFEYNRTSTPVLSNENSALSTPVVTPKKCSTPTLGWTHLQIKNEPTTPDRPSSVGSGFTDITTLTTPEKSAPSDLTAPSTPEQTTSFVRMDSHTKSPNIKVNMTSGVNLTSPTKPFATVKIGSMGGAKPVVTNPQKSSTAAQNTPKLQNIQLSNVAMATPGTSQSQQGVYLPITDGSGKVFLIPQNKVHMFIKPSPGASNQGSGQQMLKVMQSPPGSVVLSPQHMLLTSPKPATAKQSVIITTTGQSTQPLTYVINSVTSQSPTVVKQSIVTPQSVTKQPNEQLLKFSSMKKATGTTSGTPTGPIHVIVPNTGSQLPVSVQKSDVRFVTSLSSKNIFQTTTTSSITQPKSATTFIQATPPGGAQKLVQIQSPPKGNIILQTAGSKTISPGIRPQLLTATSGASPNIVFIGPEQIGAKGIRPSPGQNIQFIARPSGSTTLESKINPASGIRLVADPKTGAQPTTVRLAVDPKVTTPTGVRLSGAKPIGGRSLLRPGLVQTTGVVPISSENVVMETSSSMTKVTKETPTTTNISSAVTSLVKSNVGANLGASPLFTKIGHKTVIIKVDQKSATKTELASQSNTSAVNKPANQASQNPTNQASSNQQSAPKVKEIKVSNISFVSQSQRSLLQPAESSRSQIESVSRSLFDGRSKAAERSVFHWSPRFDDLPIVKAGINTVKVAKAQAQVPLYNLSDFADMDSLVNAIVRYHPLVDQFADRHAHPYCAPSVETFLKWNIGKRRAAELFRACMVRRHLVKLLDDATTFGGKPIMGRRELVMWCRHFGYTPLDTEISSSLRKAPPPYECAIYRSYTDHAEFIMDLERLREGESGIAEDSDDDDIDITGMDITPEVNIKEEIMSPRKQDVEIVQPTDEDLYIQDTAQQLGIDLKSTEIDPTDSPGVHVYAAHAVMFKAMSLLVSDILRKSTSIMWKQNRLPDEITAHDVYDSINSLQHCDFLTNFAMGAQISEMES